MGKNKPKHEDTLEKPLEMKTLVTVTVQFTVDTVLDSGYTPEVFGDIVVRQIEKNLMYDERTSFNIDKEVLEELNK